MALDKALVYQVSRLIKIVKYPLVNCNTSLSTRFLNLSSLTN